MSELSKKIASQLLVEAEERFLLEHDWELVKPRDVPTVIRGRESLWTYRGSFKPRRRSNWTGIERSHAVHAQKVILSQQSRKDKDDANYNKDDRE